MLKNIFMNIGELNRKLTSKLVGKEVDIEVGQTPLILIGSLAALYLYPMGEFSVFLDYLPSLFTLLITTLASSSMIKSR